MTRNLGELSTRAGFKHFYVHPPQIGRVDASNIALWIQVPPKKVLYPPKLYPKCIPSSYLDP